MPLPTPVPRLFLLLAAWPCLAAAPPGALTPGTMLDGMGQTVIDATHTAFCLINPVIVGSPGSQSFATLGPANTVFQQQSAGGSVLLSFPGLAEGEQVINGGGSEVGYSYYSQGMALLSFTSATTGTIAFPGAGNTIENGGITPAFNDFATSFDSANGRLFVSFGIEMGPCAVVFRGAFQA
jgi:hypothetical protein